MNKKKEDNPWISRGLDSGYSPVRMLAPIPFPPVHDSDSVVQEKNLLQFDFPFIPYHNEVLFPNLVYPLAIKSKALYEHISEEDDTKPKYVVVAIPDEGAEPPYLVYNEYSRSFEDNQNVFQKAMLCEVTKLIEPSSDNHDFPTLILSALERVSIIEVVEHTYGSYSCSVTRSPMKRHRTTNEFIALCSTIHDLAIEYAQKSIRDLPPGFVDSMQENNTPNYVINFACAILPLRTSVKYALLDTKTLKERAEAVIEYLQEAIAIQDLKNKIRDMTQEDLDKQQRDYFLTQQIKTIQEELGTKEDDEHSDANLFREKAKAMKWSKEVGETFEKEVAKLDRLHPHSPDYSTQYQYLQTLVDLPWNEFTPDEFDLEKASSILDRDHCGLEKVKERIIEHLAVLKLRKDMKSPILCLWGPPGVGKTSLGKSIAEALGRKYVRLSLGGLHDEAEIRGHRRTYIGALPGRIIQSIKKAGSANPVIVLDEIDKISNSYKGDPASALLEVLDPEQNKAFHDNYVDIDFDLSNVFFIATANTLNTISQPLLDRMELIQMNGYIEEEKIEIAQKHLIPKQLVEHGLAEKRLAFSDSVLSYIIGGYTRESGVRKLDKQLASIARKVARKVAAGEMKPSKKAITKRDVQEFLGPEIYTNETYSTKRYYGVVTGLAWTSVGGEILYIETSIHKGKEGQLVLTGNLGNVMKESATIALNYLRANTKKFGLSENVFSNKAFHIHVPEGAIPKDGPSAGITMVTSILSAVAKRHVKPRIAMTGEMTLRGKVLPVGGVKEKILAAKRMGITDIVLSEENKKDISQIKDIYLEGLTFHYVKDIEEVIAIALEPAKSVTKAEENA